MELASQDGSADGAITPTEAAATTEESASIHIDPIKVGGWL